MYRTDKLKELRKKRKLTVYDMGELLNITPSYYSQIENKRRRLFYDTAVKISLIFNMTPDEIFYFKKVKIKKNLLMLILFLFE